MITLLFRPALRPMALPSLVPADLCLPSAVLRLSGGSYGDGLRVTTGGSSVWGRCCGRAASFHLVPASSSGFRLNGCPKTSQAAHPSGRIVLLERLRPFGLRARSVVKRRGFLFWGLVWWLEIWRSGTNEIWRDNEHPRRGDGAGLRRRLSVVLLIAGAVYLARRYWPWRQAPAPSETRPEIDEPPADKHVRTPSDVLRLIVGVLLVLLGLLFATGASNTLVGFERDLISAFDALPKVVARVINLLSPKVSPRLPLPRSSSSRCGAAGSGCS